MLCETRGEGKKDTMGEKTVRRSDTEEEEDKELVGMSKKTTSQHK